MLTTFFKKCHFHTLYDRLMSIFHSFVILVDTRWFYTGVFIGPRVYRNLRVHKKQGTKTSSIY